MLSVTIEHEAVVRFGGRFGVTFQRTLRVPDDGRVYNLPPGLGTFPLLKVEDYADRVPADWRERGGIFLPLYQREALWLGLQAEDWRPNAVKVGVGGVNAVTGERWDAAFSGRGQDYLVCPPQLWLDGIKTGAGRIRQFVAAPLGQGYTVESQVTGEDIFGGIQIAVFEPRPGLFPDEPPPVPEFEGPLRAAGPGAPPGAQMSPAKLGIAAGGAIEQKIYPDPHGSATWDPENYGIIRVHIVNSEQYREITGRKPPRTPITAKSYTSHGLPWFALYDERAGDIATSERLSRVRSVRQIEAERGEPPNPEDAPIEVSEGQVMRLHPGKKTSGRAKPERQAQAGRKKESKHKPRRKLKEEITMAKKGKKASKGTKASKGAGASDSNEPADLRNIPFCTEISLPSELAGEALTAAVNERADNVLLPGMASGLGMASISMSTAMLDMPAIAVVAKKLWKPGRTLRVRFLDKPDPVIREKIEEYAHEWEQYISVQFAFGSSAKAEIRITCTLGIGSWSYLGTDALLIPAGEPTMNYGWFTEETPDQEFSRTVLHEFGHALGAIHEHQHPEAGIPWNKEAVYRYYKQTQGWSKGDVDAQIFNKYDKTSLNTSVYDRKSIMHYPVPKEMTLGGFQIGWNRVLSAKDKSFMRHIYPSK